MSLSLASDIISSYMYYELAIFASSKSAESTVGKIEKLLKDVASSVKVEKLGKRLLAYPIAKQTEGDYVLFNFEAEGSALSKINEALRLEREAILRYLIIKTKPSQVKPKGEKIPEGAAEGVIKKPKVTVTTKTRPKLKEEAKVSKVAKVTKRKVTRKTKRKS